MMSFCFIFRSSGINRFFTSSMMTQPKAWKKEVRVARGTDIMEIVSTILSLGLVVSRCRDYSPMALRSIHVYIETTCGKIHPETACSEILLKHKMVGAKSIWKNSDHLCGRFASNNPSLYSLRPSQTISSNRYCHKD